jgi:hypothetical protein
MSNTKRIVVATAWMVSVLLMAGSAFGQTQHSKKRKRKSALVSAAATPAPSNNSTNSLPKSVPGVSSLILFRDRNRSGSTAAVTRTSVSNIAYRQAPPVAIDYQRVSAGIVGEKTETTLSTPIAPASASSKTTTSSATTTTSTTTISVKNKLAAPSAPKPVN